MHDTTRSLVRRSAVALALVALIAAPAGAQNHRFAFGAGGGWSQPADLTPGFPSSTTLEPGWVAGLQLEAWPGAGQVGLRLGGTYMTRAVEEAPTLEYGVVSADLSFLVRLLPAGRARWVTPYVSFGGGAAAYMGSGSTPPLGGGAYGDDPVIRAMAVAGGGLDLLPYERFGLRLEAVDRIILPSLGQGPDTDGLPVSQGPQAMAVLQLRAGRINDAPRIVAAQPVAAQPAPAPAPAARAPAATQAPAGPSPEETALKERLQDSQRRIALLAERVDSLEGALGDAQAAAAPAPTRAPMARNEAFDGPLFTVQVGAFVEEATAVRWAQRLRARSLPVWVTPAVVRGQRVSRVRIGALPSASEADGLARMLKARYGWPVWVDRVADNSAIPADAVDATRVYVRSN